MTKEQLKKLVSENYFKEVFNILKQATANNPKFTNEIILQAARFKNYSWSDNIGIISRDEDLKERAIVAKNLLKTIDEIPQDWLKNVQIPEYVNYLFENSPSMKPPIFQWSVAGIGAIVLVIVLGVGTQNKTSSKLPTDTPKKVQPPNLGASASPNPEKVVTNVASYGDIITLRHTFTKQYLHSHEFNNEHPNSSKEQQVFAWSGTDHNDNWKIKEAHGAITNLNGTHVKNNDVIRLEHVPTRKNLNSRLNFPSPVTQQQEITAHGVNGVGDESDNWRIEIEGGGEWENGKNIRLKHEETGAYLHSHEEKSHPQFTRGYQEVTGYKFKDSNDYWYFAERGK